MKTIFKKGDHVLCEDYGAGRVTGVDLSVQRILKITNN
jgi:hypothetical protein